MTVKELIAELLKFEMDKIVVLPNNKKVESLEERQFTILLI